MTNISRAQVLTEARRWIGVPYLHQGRNEHGLDCVGLLLVVAWALGLSEYDVRGYGRTPHAGFLQAECDRLMHRIRLDQVAAGDVYLMRFTRDPQHLGFATERGLLHAWAGGVRRVTETAMPASWRARIVAAYALPGVR